ncbi:HK97 gp10 family phage protein [Sporolactobacillus terrae]|uniref:HK97 gp10 family phage protein n=1 Tax=Sporolactobacillus terrae TaxID=269673 RepID=UPI00056D24C0|nr:HK97 gp10 family phage protein [Sporolactobacillus terrae]
MSNKNELFHIEWDGLEELKELFDQMDENFQRILIEEFTDYGSLVEEGAKALAPKDAGDLVDSINATKAEIHGHTVEVSVGSNSKYAVRRHEEPYRKGHFPKYDNGSKFDNYYINGRGKRTRSKHRWKGQPTGRKYLQNAINATESDYKKMLERILKRTLGGDKL